jgi:hypothetical protein
MDEYVALADKGGFDPILQNLGDRSISMGVTNNDFHSSQKFPPLPAQMV